VPTFRMDCPNLRKVLSKHSQEYTTVDTCSLSEPQMLLCCTDVERMLNSRACGESLVLKCWPTMEEGEAGHLIRNGSYALTGSFQEVGKTNRLRERVLSRNQSAARLSPNGLALETFIRKDLDLT
jgi:hypothetical protein